MTEQSASGPGRFAEYARRQVADWPPLTAEQRTLIAEALGGAR